MKRVKVSVETQDIHYDMARVVRNCPVALAIKRALNKKNGICVFRDCIGLGGYKTSPKVMLPTRATKFIDRFDEGKPVQPFNFYISIPE